jgi:WD40 repeat protein
VLVVGVGDINSRTFPCVHRSFSDFVTSAGAEDFHVDTIDSNGELAIQCICQLTRLWVGVEEGLEEILAQLLYVIENWSSHLMRVVGVKMDEVQRDDESVSTLDPIDTVTDPDSNSRAQVGVEATEKPACAGITCITFSLDGTHMAIAQEDGSIRLRGTQTGNEVSLLGHDSHVTFVAFSPDGKCIVSASSDHTIRIWSSESGDMILNPLEGHMGLVHSAVFSPDGRWIVSASGDKTIRIWNSETSEMMLGPLNGHTGFVYSAIFSPDGQLIMLASFDKTICIWDSRSGDTVLGPLEGHQNMVHFAVFSADGRHILSCSRDSIFVWDSETGERVPHSFEGESAKLSFTNSETAPYIITPPRSNMPIQGTSALSYSFSLENGVVGGVVNSSVDTWLYANPASNILIGRYTGQLTLTFL